MHGWCHYCILGCAALTRPNEAETLHWVTSLLSAAPFLSEYETLHESEMEVELHLSVYVTSCSDTILVVTPC